MCELTNMYYNKLLYMIVIFLVLVGSVNWLAIGLADTNLVRLVLPLKYARWLYIIIGLAAVPLLFQRDIYLPFLGETFMPGGVMATKTPQNANDQITIQAAPGAKIAYWVSEPDPNQGSTLPTSEEAYGEFENSGVVVADTSGLAILRFRGPPQAYTVPVKGRLEPHVHFRVARPDGFLEPVQVVYLKDGRIEAFSNMF
jgi:uncharacterized membrane protein YuzA (DUF378 family)